MPPSISRTLQKKIGGSEYSILFRAKTWVEDLSLGFFLGQKNLEGWGSKLRALVPWSIGSLHTKSWPPTMLRTLPKVSGGGGWWIRHQI